MLQEYRIGGTYYGYDSQSKQLKAYPTIELFKADFGRNPNPKAATLPFSSNDGLVVAANQNPGKAIDGNTLLPVGQAPATQNNLPATQTPAGQVTGTLPNGQKVTFTDAAAAKSNGATEVKPVNETVATPKTETPAAKPDPAKVAEGVKFTGTNSYKGLSKDEQDLVNMAFNLIEVGGEDEAKKFAAALTSAKQIADPYYKSLLTLAQGEIASKIAGLNNDYEGQVEIINRTKSELLSDVSSQKDFLSLEQQADLAKLGRGYDEDILKIKDEAADKGIVFASGYKSLGRMETNRTTEQGDVVESTNRKYNYQINQLTERAQRGDIDAAKQLESLTGKKTLALQDIGRIAETKLGSANVPGLTGYTPVGGVAGTLEEEKRKNIISDVNAFVSLQKGFI